MPGTRHKHNKRKEAYVKSKKPPKRRMKDERDKDVFKRRKFIKNVVEEDIPKDEIPSASEEEEEETGFGQMMQMFGGNVMSKHAIESDSSDENEEEENENTGDEKQGQEPLGVSDCDEERSEGVEDHSEDGDDDLEEDEEDDNQQQEEGVEDVEQELHDSEDEEIEEDKSSSNNDPFAGHFEVYVDQSLISSVNIKNNWKDSSVKMPVLGNLQVTTLDVDEDKSPGQSLIDKDEDDSRLKELQRRLISSVPDPKVKSQLHLKQKLNQEAVNLSGFEKELLGVVSQYKDFLFTDRSQMNAEQIRKTYTIHALNHILKTQTKILNNNAKHEARGDGDEKLRDQGFARPKVVIVVPFKESCRCIVELLMKMFSPENQKGSVANRKRFNEDYVKVETIRKDKPDDYYDTFQGDTDDSFKLGIAVTKKTIKLYTDFYSSDIIITSPLGLRLVTGVEGQGGKTDTDFLSSIEMMIVDQAEVLLMQNWDHVATIMEQLHQQPKESHGVDYGRIRLWCLDGNSKYYRQTMIFSGVPSPEINTLWRKCSNYMGKVKVISDTKVGAMTSILSDTGLVWHRLTSDTLSGSVEARFKYFTEKVMPGFKKDSMYHTCVFVPSYFDYVKVRNWFKASDLDYAEISEYTKEKKIAQARDMFYHNEKHFLLYTERSHFYSRRKIKGIRHLIFYQPPTFGWMFSELCNLLQKSFQNPRGGSESNMSITIIYSKYDIQRLNLCVGTETAAKMVTSEKTRHIFKPGTD